MPAFDVVNRWPLSFLLRKNVQRSKPQVMPNVHQAGGPLPMAPARLESVVTAEVGDHRALVRQWSVGQVTARPSRRTCFVESKPSVARRPFRAPAMHLFWLSLASLWIAGSLVHSHWSRQSQGAQGQVRSGQPKGQGRWRQDRQVTLSFCFRPGRLRGAGRRPQKRQHAAAKPAGSPAHGGAGDRGHCGRALTDPLRRRHT